MIKFLLTLDLVMIFICSISIYKYWIDKNIVIAFPSFIIGMILVKLLFIYKESNES